MVTSLWRGASLLFTFKTHFTSKTLNHHRDSHSMPPPKKEPDPNRPRTRAGNANVHPGTAAKDALRVRNLPRDPEVIQKEKQEKEEKRASRKKKAEEDQAKEESAAKFVEDYRARKDTEASNEAVAIPRQKEKKGKLNLLNVNNFLYCTQLKLARLPTNLAIPENLSLPKPIKAALVVRRQTVSTSQLKKNYTYYFRDLWKSRHETKE